MKNFLPLLLLSALTFLSCKKSDSDNIPSSLEGTWKMIQVRDNATNTSINKPSSIQKDVIITFHPTNSSIGILTGKTPTNEIEQNSYSLGANQSISIPVLSMTKVAETSWGAEFVDNIRDAEQYSFHAGGKLNIRTTKKTLTFKKQ
jgi:hypothetical protein